VQAPGYGRRHLGWRDGAAEVTVALKPAAIVTGEIVDKHTGQPLDGIHLGLLSTAGAGYTASIRRGDESRFLLEELPEGDYTLTVSIDFGGQFHEERITLEPGQTLTRSLRLAKSEAKGNIVFQPDPKPREPAKLLKVGDELHDRQGLPAVGAGKGMSVW
jgi:hypothetical protein